MDDWLPEDHLARFVLDVVSMLDLEPVRAACAGRGSLLCSLFGNRRRIRKGFCSHGELPVPAPATMKLLEGVLAFVKGKPFERATPTGIALLRAFGAEYGDMPSGIIGCAEYGLGDRESDLPNLLQAALLREEGNPGMPELISCS